MSYRRWQSGRMRFNRSQFLAALAGLATFPFRWLPLPFKASRVPPQPTSTLNRSTRRGPWLGDWRRGPWVPVQQSVHPTAQRLILAALRHEMLPLRYWGGSTPGRERSVSPGLVFQLSGRGPLYVAGYCHRRRAERVFRVERVELLNDEDEIICITE